MASSDLRIKMMIGMIKAGEDVVRFLVAEGTPPVKGSPGEFRPRVEAGLAAGKEDEKGKMDLRERGFVNIVKVNTVLADIVLPGEGTPGRSVRGEEVAAEMGDPPPIPEDLENVQIDAEGTKLQASIDGQLFFSEDRIAVTPEITIPGDVGYSVGNLNFDGEVHIEGSVKPGFVVESGTLISIGGGVEQGARILSKGPVQVTGTICCGKEEGTVEAGENLVAGEIVSSRVEAHGDVTVNRLILDSFVVCHGRLNMLDEKGEIRGGHVEGVAGLSVPVAGSDSGVPTTLVAGLTLFYEEEAKRIGAAVDEATRRIEEAARNFEKRYGGVIVSDLSAEEKERYLDARGAAKQNQDVAMKELAERGKLRRELLAKCSRSNEGTVHITKIGFPGTTIRIGQKAAVTLLAETPAREYSQKAGKIATRDL